MHIFQRHEFQHPFCAYVFLGMDGYACEHYASLPMSMHINLKKTNKKKKKKKKGKDIGEGCSGKGKIGRFGAQKKKKKKAYLVALQPLVSHTQATPTQTQAHKHTTK